MVEGESPVDVFLPDDLVAYDDERALHFILLPGERRATASRVTLTVDVLAPFLTRAGPDGLDAELRFCETGGELIAEAPIIDCISAELDLNGLKYLAADGQFFAVDAGFLDRLNAEARRVAETDLLLPCYGGGAEAAWNQAVADRSSDTFVCLDTQLIRLAGETPFEPADLVHASGALIHGKRKGRSSALSYLFVQARRSCQMLGQVPAATDALLAMLESEESVARTAAQKSLTSLSRQPSDIQVVLAILGDWHGRGVTSLPLLAKIEFVDTVRRLRQWGYRPTVALVGLCSRPMQ